MTKRLGQRGADPGVFIKVNIACNLHFLYRLSKQWHPSKLSTGSCRSPNGPSCVLLTHKIQNSLCLTPSIANIHLWQRMNNEFPLNGGLLVGTQEMRAQTIMNNIVG